MEKHRGLWTQVARDVVFRAQQEAQRRGSSVVGKGHLLIGVLSRRGCAACNLLNRLGKSPQELLVTVGAALKPNGKPHSKQLQLSVSAASVVGSAYKESRTLNNDFIGTEHFLLALANDSTGSAGIVLKAAGLDVHTLRLELSLLDADKPKVWPPAPVD